MESRYRSSRKLKACSLCPTQCVLAASTVDYCFGLRRTRRFLAELTNLDTKNTRIRDLALQNIIPGSMRIALTVKADLQEPLVKNLTKIENLYTSGYGQISSKLNFLRWLSKILIFGISQERCGLLWHYRQIYRQELLAQNSNRDCITLSNGRRLPSSNFIRW